MMRAMRTILAITGAAFCMLSCLRTPNPNAPRFELGNAGESVYQITLYSYAELSAMFPSASYGALPSTYVSTAGNDSAAGTIGAPLRSIAAAVGKLGTNGGIIRVRAGTYYEYITVTVGGSDKAHPVVLYSEDGPLAAKIDAGGRYACIETTKNYVVIDGFELMNTSKYGVGVYSGENMTGNVPEAQATGKYCVVRNCKIHDIGIGNANCDAVKGAGNRYYLIENNDISRVGGDVGVDCVASYHVIIRSNTIYDCEKGAGYCKGGSANVYWVANTIRSSGQYGIMLGGWTSLSSVFRGTDPETIPEGYHQMVFNNVFIDCRTTAVMVTGGEDVYICNNTFFNCNDTGTASLIYVNDDGVIYKKSSRITVLNNIAYNDSTKPFIRIYGSVNGAAYDITHAYNYFFCGTAVNWGNGYAPGTAESATAVSFVNAAAGNFQLNPGAGVNDGTNISWITFDRAGTVRPNGIFDRGSYEQ